MNTNVQMGEIVELGENGIRWDSVVSGVLIALTVGVLFDLLGMAIGFSLFSPEKEVLYTLTIGTLIWLAMTSCSSMYLGGWVASRFSNADTIQGGIVYGAVVSAATILILLVITMFTAGALLSNSFSALQRVVSAAGSATTDSASFIGDAAKGISTVAPELSNKVKEALPSLKPVIAKINQKADELMSQVDMAPSSSGVEMSAEKIKSELENLIALYLDAIEKNNFDEARQNLVNKLAQLTGKSPAEIMQTVDEWKQMYVEAQQKIKETAKDVSKQVAKGMSEIALINFFLVLLGIVAGAIGGVNGVRNKYNR